MGYVKGIKWDYELVKIYVENLGYTLMCNEYKNNSQKLIIKDIYGYYYVTILASLKNNNIPEKFNISNLYTIQNIKLWCSENNKLIELLDTNYFGNHKKLKWKCLNENCGEIFEMTWAGIFNNNNCPYCCTSPQRVGLSNCLATKRPDLVKEWHPTNNGVLTPYDVTCGSGKEVWWKCLNNPDHEWKTVVKDRKTSNCPYCSGTLPSKDYNLAIINPKLCEEWDYEKNEKTPEEYTPNSNKKVFWKCNKCSNEWKDTINHRNNGRNCPKCSLSQGEVRCGDFLLNHNICYESQKKYKGLLGTKNGNLSYDFYLPDYNLLIEYQGEQHEKFCKAVHKTNQDFEKQQEHDRRKREYAKENNIRFLEIWYWDMNNIEDILFQFLNKKKDLLKQSN